MLEHICPFHIPAYVVLPCFHSPSFRFGSSNKICFDPTRLRSVPPAVQRLPVPPSTQCRKSNRGGRRAGSISFQPHHHIPQFGRHHGKLHGAPPVGLSGRHSQRHQHSEMESRVHPSGEHGGRGPSPDRPATGERGAGCMEPRGPQRD